MKTSLEVEYWVVDDDGALAPPRELLDVSEHVDPEFVEPMIEIKTTPCTTATELRSELRGRVRRVVEAADAAGKRLVPLGTPLFAAPAEIPYREKRGTELQRRIVGPAFDNARFCAGTHVHIERSSTVDQLNALTALDPAQALVTSSSHHRGEPFPAAARSFLYRRCCYAACPDQGQLWPYVESVDEWERRLDDAFETFLERAAERGVDPEAVEAEYGPYEAVWTPVRLRDAFPTVEWRSPDAALPSEVLRLTEAVRSIVTRADARGTAIDPDDDPGPDGPVSLPAFDRVREVTDAALDGGLTDEVATYLGELGFEPAAYEPATTRHPDGRVSRREARRLRLAAADRLEADLERVSVRQ